MRSATRPIIPDLVAARQSIEGLLVIGKDEAYCQPCLSPVWDTALAAHALLETGGEAGAGPVKAALDVAQAAPDPRRQGRLGGPAP